MAARVTARFLAGSLSLLVFLAARAVAGTNILADANNFDNTPMVDDPWAGVVNGAIHVPVGTQPSVNDAGRIATTPFAPSIAVGDLNGDGLPDLVVASSSGYFWYFPNSGTAKAPKFTTGEVMPIWLGSVVQTQGPLASMVSDPRAANDPVPRIQLVDFANEGKLSIVAGNFAGQLLYIHNQGNRTQPSFSTPEDLTSLIVPTHSNGKLWCNVLAPYLDDWFGRGQLDLLLGEGTYASNCIYLLSNKGSNLSPTFNEQNMTKIIFGNGREILNPQVVDWNHDGKPDIITGERAGFVTVFLNTSTDPKAPPQFDQGQHVSFGGSERAPGNVTVCVADLNGSGLPSLLLGFNDGRVMYAQNTGTVGAPAFGQPVPIAAVNPYPKIGGMPPGWEFERAYGLPYSQIDCVDAQTDPTFTPPAPEFKSALRCYTLPHHPALFQPMSTRSDLHVVTFGRTANPGFFGLGTIRLEVGVRYKLRFWVKTTGDIRDLNYLFFGVTDGRGKTKGGGQVFLQKGSVSASSDWTQFSTTFEVKSDDGGKKDPSFSRFSLAYSGDGAVEVDGFDCEEEP